MRSSLEMDVTPQGTNPSRGWVDDNLPMPVDEQSPERGGPLLLATVLGFFLILHSVDEVRYSVWGKNATGTVTQTAMRQRWGRRCPWTELRVDFRYTDASGATRSETDQSDLRTWSESPAVGDAIPVQYLQEGRARLARRADPSAIVLCFTLIFLGVLWWSYNTSV